MVLRTIEVQSSVTNYYDTVCFGSTERDQKGCEEYQQCFDTSGNLSVMLTRNSIKGQICELF